MKGTGPNPWAGSTADRSDEWRRWSGEWWSDGVMECDGVME